MVKFSTVSGKYTEFSRVVAPVVSEPAMEIVIYHYSYACGVRYCEVWLASAELSRPWAADVRDSPVASLHRFLTCREALTVRFQWFP